jgi:hypothetical protein
MPNNGTLIKGLARDEVYRIEAGKRVLVANGYDLNLLRMRGAVNPRLFVLPDGQIPYIPLAQQPLP